MRPTAREGTELEVDIFTSSGTRWIIYSERKQCIRLVYFSEAALNTTPISWHCNLHYLDINDTGFLSWICDVHYSRISLISSRGFSTKQKTNTFWMAKVIANWIQYLLLLLCSFVRLKFTEISSKLFYGYGLSDKIAFQFIYNIKPSYFSVLENLAEVVDR